MKVIIILFLLLLTATAFGELTKEDIRIIVREENHRVRKTYKGIYRSESWGVESEN